MTTAADDAADELAFEAFLAGRTGPYEADGGRVAAFAGAVRATSTQPGRPNAALAELLATGLLTDQSSPSIRTAPSAGSSPRRSRIRRRRRFAMFFPALLAKFLSAGAVAQAASGAGIALVAFTGAGVVGVLPGPVQDSFSSVVGSETAADGTTVPADQAPTGDTTGTGAGDGTAVDDPAVESPAVETPAPAAAEFDATGWADNGPSGTQTFSEWVSQGAHNKDALEAAAAARGVENFRFGQIVSEWAHKKHIDPSEVEGVEGADDTTTATPTPTTESVTKSEDSGKTSHGSGGHGNSGSGNSGRGHN